MQFHNGLIKLSHILSLSLTAGWCLPVLHNAHRSTPLQFINIISVVSLIMSNYMFYMLVPSPVQCNVHHCSATFTMEQCDFPSMHSLEPVDDLHFKTLVILNAHIDTEGPVSMVTLKKTSERKGVSMWLGFSLDNTKHAHIFRVNPLLKQETDK